ncbi:MAG TPA: CARDB domain-containing protein [Gemmatimonadales bacterium]|nr:CARDB domain-containing protein [Gemmatimonadales bacterium]
MTSRRVRSRACVLLTLLLVACGGSSTGPSTGSLALEVIGLPPGTEADVTVSGPSGYIRLVGHTETLSGLPSGTYTVAAVGVTTGDAQYLPSPPSQSVEVSGGDAAGAQVLYASGNGSLAITVSGLPDGTDAAITVSGPGGYTRQVTASETLSGLGPGQYTLTALAVTSGSEQYSPAPSSQTKTVGVGASVPALVSYSTGGAAGFNLWVHGVYLVQSVQTYNRGVPLIQDRDALLRVFVTANQINAAAPDVEVSLYRDGALLSEMTIPAPALTTPLGPDEATLNSSWNLILDRSLIQGNLSIVAEVDPENLIAEGNEGDNTFPESGTPLALDVRDASPFRVTLVPVITKANSRLGNVTPANMGEYLEAAMRMHPLRSDEALLHTAYTTATDMPLQSDNGNGAWTAVLGEMLALRKAESSSRYYYGVVNPSYSSGIAGVGYIGAPAAIGWDKAGSRGSVAAHEWGHNWNRAHAPCGSASSPDANYPYTGGQIGVIGYDVVNETLKPADAHDLMGYCSNEWISDYTYLGVMNFRSSEASLARGLGETVQPGILVWGRIESGRAVLEPAFSVVARPSLPRQAGPYRLEGRATGGGRVFGFDFAPLEVADDPLGAKHFAFVVPVRPERAARLVSLDLVGPGVRASVVPAASETPAVEVTRAAPGRVALRWDASKAPMLMVRDPATGQVLSFARSGAAEIAAPRDEVTITVSDRVRSRELRLRAQSR